MLTEQTAKSATLSATLLLFAILAVTLVPSRVVTAQDSCINDAVKRGEYYAGPEDWDLAVAAFQEALAEAPTCESIQQGLVEAQQALDAQHDIEQTEQINELLLKAHAYEELGMTEEAQATYVKILDLDVNHEKARSGLDRIVVPVKSIELLRRKIDALLGTAGRFFTIFYQLGIAALLTIVLIKRIKRWASRRGQPQRVQVLVQPFEVAMTDALYKGVAEGINYFIADRLVAGPTGILPRVREVNQRTSIIPQSAGTDIKLLGELWLGLRRTEEIYRVAGIVFKDGQVWGARFWLENAVDGSISAADPITKTGDYPPLELVERLAEVTAQRISFEIDKIRRDQGVADAQSLVNLAAGFGDQEDFTQAEEVLEDADQEAASAEVDEETRRRIRENKEFVARGKEAGLPGIINYARQLASTDESYRRQLANSKEHKYLLSPETSEPPD